MRVNYVHSTAHLLVPRIVGVILIILLIAIIISDYMKARKNGGKSAKKAMFAEGFDKIKLFGSFALFFAYIALLEPLGFLISSILAMFGFNVIFEGKKEKRSLILSAAISVVFPTLLWFIFGYVFNITLP